MNSGETRKICFWPSFMGSISRPKSSGRRSAAAAGGIAPMRRQRMGAAGAAGGEGGGRVGGASCRGSTMLISLLVAFLMAFFILFGFTFTGSSSLQGRRGVVLPDSQEFDGKDEEEIRAAGSKVDSRRSAAAAAAVGVGVYGYKIVNEFVHDTRAFTQGLLFAGNGTLYESTGLHGRSSVREVDLLTGKVRRTRMMSSQEFGEGLALWKNRLFQVSWRTSTVFIYDRKTLRPKGQAVHPMQDGWGLTTSKEYIIGSDGTSKLYFMKPDTFEEVKSFVVNDEGKEVGWLNELEYVHDEIWANIWQGECIARISPEDGSVLGWIVLQGLRNSLLAQSPQGLDVLNGIAWDEERDKLYVTGKLWPKLFEIELIDNTTDTKSSLESVRTLCNIGHQGFMR